MIDDPADLAHLHGIAVPSLVPWWPPAVGWWILAVAVLAVAVAIVLRRLQRWRADAYRRAALRELTAIEGMAESKSVEAASALSAVLKRTALVAFPRTDCAALSGAAWLEFLDRTGDGGTFSTGPARLLPQIACGGPADDEALPVALAEARRWIATHRAARPC